MTVTCVSCGQPIEAGSYRLVGVEQGSWASQYAHRGTCEAEARQRHAKPAPPVKRKRSQPVVEELTMEEPEPFPDEGLPWFGLEQRRRS